LSVFYYGLTTANYDRIIAKQPGLVVLGDHKGDPNDTTPSYFHTRDAAVKAIAYIPMNYGGQGIGVGGPCPWSDGPDGACSNTPRSWDCTAVTIATRIQNAMNAGYDGVFFDETPTNKPNYVQNCAALVKGFGGQKIVIMNPGTVPPAAMLSDNVDVVSVENQYTASLLGFGVRSARFMAVQGGVSDAATAVARLNTFRVNGGYWYYATSAHSDLPAWFESFADAVNAPDDEPHDCGTNPIHVAFRTYQNVAGQPPITGLWSVVTSGGNTQTGFSPTHFVVSPGSASVNFGDFQQYHFHHWDDGSTLRPRNITVNGNRRVNGFYDIF
jgi:hypothetical protein